MVYLASANVNVYRSGICDVTGFLRPIFGIFILLPGFLAVHAAENVPGQQSKFPCAEAQIAHYTSYRVSEPIRIDGILNETAWQRAPQSPRFVDIISGGRTVHDTRASLLWD